MEGVKMKHIFIVGARGYHAEYGGWETFVSKLVDNYDDKDTLFHVSMYTSDINLKSYKRNNVIVDPIYVKEKGSVKMFFYAVKAYKFYLDFIEKNNLSSCYIYVLGLKLFHYLKKYRKKAKNLDVKVYLNPDGLEWKRSKWSYPIKKFFLISERLMLNNCDLIICDSLGIEEYIVGKFPKLTGKTKYIAYGCDEFNFKKINEKEILKEYGLSKDDYYLLVGRCVPENNFELIVKDFMKSKSDKKLIVITNLSSSNYYNELASKTDLVSDNRIVFIDGVYDNEKLAVIRKNAFAYIHGHSVGGTNPSLIEGMSLTDINILYDVCFNKYVGKDACLYFKEAGSLTKIINDEKKLIKVKKDLGLKAKNIVKDNFTWKKIVSNYKEIFK